ncbi:NADH-quinone oxidoreductase subunit M [Candidatus Magnetominusculus xianensis]|uniref:NADH-quinone oxidoreductase subunit M n=1 Tax=Candidatus Magnetominusculus xianensis TaxID=1748249 RepID=A0ABR5SI85_9BACT|nr:NADH-quinone oxidoreductase subunit M [Candidatus Magnetominusculus xianensis]KWT92048.1 NADH-quinone oxidoreductase subunit M [Candidatus Magnetominusculus xianensis]MBF0404628.1 NADH-quinone oxidoreductase subunit M [Nitrospirota bacterium]
MNANTVCPVALGQSYVLTVAIVLPVIAALAMLFINKERHSAIRWFALLATVANLIGVTPLFTNFDKTSAQMQFVAQYEWIKAWNINYYVGVDGISVLFVLLSAIVAILCVMVSWTSVKDKVKEFYIAILLIEGAMIGVFSALDMFLFYMFWEAMLIPMYLLIGIWGGPNRLYAAIKFFLYTLTGSVLMLLGVIAIYLTTGTFDMVRLMNTQLPANMQMLLFWAFFAAFAVKVPMFPVHTWLPDAHTEAPTAGSVILAAILIKMGAYGFLRFSLPMFPDASQSMAPVMIALSVIGIIYGGIICLSQTDLKRLIAYSSVSHMGFVTLGIFSLNMQGMEGGILQMINHGVITGGLFLCVGMVYERSHTREIADYGGLADVMPVFAAFFMVFTFASVGLPATNGFVGEFLIILGGFTANKTAGILSATGVIIGAVYMLWLYQRVFYTDVNEKIAGLGDITLREMITLVPLLILVFWIGVYPSVFTGFMDVSVAQLLGKLKGGNMHTTLIHTLK